MEVRRLGLAATIAKVFGVVVRGPAAVTIDHALFEGVGGLLRRCFETRGRLLEIAALRAGSLDVMPLQAYFNGSF